MRNATLYIFPLLGLSALVPSVALADAKTYSAAECVANTSNLQYSLGRAYNSSSTSSLGVWCPLINDVMDAGISSGWVRVYDSSDSEDFLCTLRNYAQSGSSLVGSWQTDNSEFEGVDVLEFGAVGPAGSARTYHFQCSVPRTEDGDRSYIMMYHINEA